MLYFIVGPPDWVDCYRYWFKPKLVRIE